MKKFILFILLLILGGTGMSTTWYVSTTGNDSNPGTQTQPWKTIQHGIDVAVAGDTVLIRGGVYLESLAFGNSGNATDGHIVFMNYPQETPIVDGTGTSGMMGMFVEEQSYIIIDGFEVRNWTEAITIINNSHHLKLNNLDVHDFDFGVTFRGYGCHDIEVNNVDVHGYGGGNFDTYGFDASYDTLTNNPHHDFVFNNCKAHSDMNPVQNIDGFATGHWCQTSIQYNFTFNHCMVWDTFDGFDMSAKNTLINGCLAYNVYNGAWKLWSDQISLVNCIGYFTPSAAHPSCNCIAELDPGFPEGFYKKTVSIQNCTFYGGDHTIHVYKSGLDTLVLRNTIVSNGAFVSLYFEDSTVLNPSYRGDYNIFNCVDSNRIISVAGMNDYTFSAWQAYSGKDSHSMMAPDLSAVFMDTASDNLHLRPGSPAIDAGSAAGAPNVDYEGYPRPYGAGYDIGAYEMNPSSSLPGAANGKEHVKLLPNPAIYYTLVEFPKTGSYRVYLMDGLGRTVLTKEVRSTNVTHLDVSGISPGTYFVFIRTDDRTSRYSEKLVVAPR
jgi:hypothetical protein